MLVHASKTSRFAEVERKFDVVEPTVAPSFDGIAAVARVERSPAQQLDAVYFDTPAGDLASNRITLRRRTGGSDEGWHLKLPAGSDTRTEVRAPLRVAEVDDRDEVPAELLDVVLAVVRDRPLAPVARITTLRAAQVLYRSDAAALAEFCDDRVTAWSAGAADEGDAEQHWHEWELELADPDAAAGTDLLDRLSNRLLDAGAVPARHGSKLARVLGTMSNGAPERPADPVYRAVAEQLGELLVWDRAVRADAHDAVHQMRVTVRKIRSLLQSRPEFGSSEHAWVLNELRELGAVLGVARDAEVLAERYQQALDRLPAELVRGPVRERLVDGAGRRYQTGLRRSMMAMRTQRYFRLLDALDAVVAAPPAPSTDADTSDQTTIDAAYKKVRKAAKAAAASEVEDHDEALHRIRKKAKRLRYTAGAIGATKVSEQAKAIQSLLGDHQDSVVSREHLGQEAQAARAANEDTFTYGVLYQQETDLAERCRQGMEGALRKLNKAARKAR